MGYDDQDSWLKMPLIWLLSLVMMAGFAGLMAWSESTAILIKLIKKLQRLFKAR